MPDCVGVLKYGLYSVRPALPESRSFQMFLDVSKCVQKFLETRTHITAGVPVSRLETRTEQDTESLERLRQQISITHCA
eukprot:jgi/Chrzof1/7374/Cz02g21140.t1